MYLQSQHWVVRHTITEVTCHRSRLIRACLKKNDRIPQDDAWGWTLPSTVTHTQCVPPHTLQRHVFSNYIFKWRIKVRGLEHTRCSSRGWWFDSQNPHGSPQLFVTPVPWLLTPSSVLWGYCMYVVHQYVWRQNTHMNKIKCKKGIAIKFRSWDL